MQQFTSFKETLLYLYFMYVKMQFQPRLFVVLGRAGVCAHIYFHLFALPLDL